MLYLNFALNFEALAEDLMDKVEKCWNDPFNPPVVIFPDLALEQWFKLKWIERGEGKVLANLKTQFLDSFLFDALAGTDKPRLARLSYEVLQNIILAWLREKDSCGVENWRSIDMGLDSEIRNYLADKKNGDAPDESRLFDLASQISQVFMEYEMSRPGAFMSAKDGIIHQWETNDKKNFFKDEKHNREEWQRKLYRFLFTGSDCILNRVNQKFEREHKGGLVSLPRLFEIRKGKDGGVDFPGARDVPVFLFWHAGIGQFYRVALREYAKSHKVYAYIQNPCMDFWEDIVDGESRIGYSLTKNDSKQYEEHEKIDTEFPDNMLLAKWGRAGRDNVRLWCESVNYDFKMFNNDDDIQINDDYTMYYKPVDKEPEIARDTVLHKIQYDVAHRSEEINTYEQDESLTIHCAPSKIREIENLHSEICKLLQNKEANVNIRDILIVAPNINDYRTAINQVFAAERSQAEGNGRDKRNGKPIEQPALYIPFTILDGEPRESLTARALKSLFQIALTGVLSRLEFFELVRNPVVQLAREIEPDEINAWEEWITGMNVFRDRDVIERDGSTGNIDTRHFEDWKIGIKRLLLARLTDSRVKDGEDILMPYGDLESGDSASLCRFVDAVNSLEEFSGACRGQYVEGFDKKALEDYIVTKLTSWLAMKNAPRELAFENIIYKNVMNHIEHIKLQYDAGAKKISLKCLEQSIMNAAKTSRYIVGSLFVNGLTFMNFTPNRVIPVKHLFFLGMDASGYPGHDTTSSLDLRTGEMWPGDSQNALKNRYAFLCQLMSTSEGLHLSYVNRNLQSDEEFFPSSVINDLMTYLSRKDKWTPKAVSLDETRKLSELFTRRSLRNHDLFRKMTDPDFNGLGKKFYFDNEKNPFFNPQNDKNILPDRVTLNKLKTYLNDPFQFRIGELMQNDNDDTDPQRIVYEPIDVNQIELLGTIKTVAQLMIRKDKRYACLPVDLNRLEDDAIEHATLTIDEINDKIETVVNRFMQELRSSGFRTSFLYEDLVKKRILGGAKMVSQQMLEGALIDADSDNEIKFSIEQELENGESKTWMLQGNAEWHKWDEVSSTLTVMSVMLGKYNDVCYNYLTPYMSALALIVQNGRQNSVFRERIHVNLYICCTDDIRTLSRNFEMSSGEAETILKNIFKDAFIEQFAKAAPLIILEDNMGKAKEGQPLKITPKIKSFEKLEGTLLDNGGPWKYFKKGKLFDLHTDIGYDAYHHKVFVEQWNAVKKRQERLIYPLKPAFIELTVDQDVDKESKNKRGRK